MRRTRSLNNNTKGDTLLCGACSRLPGIYFRNLGHNTIVSNISENRDLTPLVFSWLNFQVSAQLKT